MRLPSTENRSLTSAVNLIPEGPVASVVELAVGAEQLGFERAWVYDEGLATRDVYVTMTAIAFAIASVDELSRGRGFLGLGAGGSLTLDPLGLERRAPVATVRSVLTACRPLFAGESVTMEAPSFALRSARLDYARADLEIWVAGRGPKMLAMGAELTDGVMLDFVHVERLFDLVAALRAGTGRNARVSYSTMIVTDDQAMADTKPHMTYRLVDSPPEIRARIGMDDRQVVRVREALADGLHAAAGEVRDDWVRPFVLSGTVDDCARRMR